jgi:hypothetical protein
MKLPPLERPDLIALGQDWGEAVGSSMGQPNKPRSEAEIAALIEAIVADLSSRPRRCKTEASNAEADRPKKSIYEWWGPRAIAHGLKRSG